MTEIPWSGPSGSKGHPSDPLAGLHCARTQVTPIWVPSQGRAKRQGSAPTAPPPPNGPSWQPQHRCDPRSDPQPKIATLLGRTLHQTLSTPSLGPF
jgi:hypothetical protein